MQPGHGLADDSSPSVTGMNGSRRVVSIVDQQVVAPEHMTGHVMNQRHTGSLAPDHMTNHMMSQRHTGSESSINKMRSKRKHQYERVRAPHPYEYVEQEATSSQTDSQTLSQQEALELSDVKPKASKGSPAFKRWKHSLTRKDNRAKSPQGQNFPLNASDSKLHRHSKKKQGAKNSPAPGKRFSAGNIVDDTIEDKAAAKLRNRMSSPEGQLQTQMLSRYFPTDPESIQEGSSGSRDQVRCSAVDVLIYELNYT